MIHYSSSNFYVLKVSLTPEAKITSAFYVRSGLYLWRVMPFGLCKASSTFECVLEIVLQGPIWKSCLVYLDDFLIVGRDENELLSRMNDVLTRLKISGLKIKPRKCRLFQNETEYLGHINFGNGIKPNPDKLR